MFVPRAAQPARPFSLPKGLWISGLHGWSKCRRVAPSPACSSDAQLLLGWVTQQVVGATVPAVVARGIHDAKRLWRSRD